MGKFLTEDQALEMIRAWDGFGELEKKSKVKNVSVKPLSIDDQGFLSIVYDVVVNFEDSSKFVVIIKTPSLNRFNEELKADVTDKDKDGIMFQCHNHECEVYTLLSSIDAPMAKLYACKTISSADKNGYLVMESFIGKANIMGISYHTNAGQCLNLARKLGKLRAEAEKLDLDKLKHLNAGFIQENDFVAGLIKPNIQFMLEYDYNTFKPLVDRLEKYGNSKFYEYCLMTKAHDLGVASFFHSDLHGGNLMFKLNPDGSVSNELAALIDFQSAIYGNALCDLSRFTGVTVDVDVRRSIEDDLIDAYYSTYLQYSKNPNPNFTKAVCRELYDLGVILQAVDWQMIFGIFASKPTGKNDFHNEALKARMALKARLCMEDGIRLIEKYAFDKLQNKLGNLTL